MSPSEALKAGIRNTIARTKLDITTKGFFCSGEPYTIAAHAKAFLSDKEAEEIYGMMNLVRERHEKGLPYLWNAGVVRELVDVSQALRDQYSHTRMFGVGNSPAYVVYGIDKLSNLSGLRTETGHVPFSDRYVSLEENISGGPVIFCAAGGKKYMEYHVDVRSPFYRDVMENSEIYRKRLASMGLHPREIVDKLQHLGDRTAVLDNMQTGGSFVSFIHFMYTWAESLGIGRKVFSKAFNCVALTNRDIPSTFVIPENGLCMDVSVVAISLALQNAITGNNSAGVDRFVPHYNPREWRLPPEDLAIKNSKGISVVKGLIDAAVYEKLKRRPTIELPQARDLRSAQPS